MDSVSRIARLARIPEIKKKKRDSDSQKKKDQEQPEKEARPEFPLKKEITLKDAAHPLNKPSVITRKVPAPQKKPEEKPTDKEGLGDRLDLKI